ncbi:MAG TPA: transcription antitermination factor NusB [Bryobacteraceae bacterium]|nr:transcription antitermination factor NusB [Bryobacteraceae bacterium]
MASRARQAAFRILLRVDQGAWASELLAREGLSAADAGLTTAIVFGVLRHQAQLDFVLSERVTLKKLDPEVLISLRIGAYQLLFLDRVPVHAAVSESVDLVKRARKSSASGLVNAVLRRVGRTVPEWPSREVRWSMPAWLLERWDAEYGAETSERIAAAFLQTPETWVRNPPATVQAEPAADVPGAWRLVSGSAEGLRVQDVGSQTVVPLLELQAGMRFLDVCAAPGNKTAQALETEGVTAVACDRYDHRLRNVSGCARVVLDGTEPLPFRPVFDRILVDAPCSGTGTLGRNPEIRWKLKPGDIEELHTRQVAILRNSLQLLNAEGRLVYATCSLESRENQDVVAASGAEVLREHRRIPGIDAGDGFYAAVLRR